MEFSGDVVAIGSEVTKARLGERVTVEPCIVCGKCDACRHGQYGYCEHISFTYRNGDGAMADYVVVKEPYVYELPDYLSYETGALIEPLSVATHAVRRADIRLGETVLIIGAGAIGMRWWPPCAAAAVPPRSSSPISLTSGWKWQKAGRCHRYREQRQGRFRAGGRPPDRRQGRGQKL